MTENLNKIIFTAVSILLAVCLGVNTYQQHTTVHPMNMEEMGLFTVHPLLAARNCIGTVNYAYTLSQPQPQAAV